MENNPRVISIANSKGGVGKSCVSILLAVALAKKKNKKVLIIDCDSQGSVTEMYEREKETREDDPLIEVEELTPRKVQTFLKRFGADYDIIFIDIPRMTDKKKDTATVMLIYNCEGVLVPIVGNKVDVLSSQDFTEILDEAASDKKEMGDDFKYYGFINRRNQRKSNEVAETDMKKGGLKMFSNSLPDLKIFTHPSFYSSILDSAEGERRFTPFFKEFCRKFKL
jgi:chromosome partitioning protein